MLWEIDFLQLHSASLTRRYLNTLLVTVYHLLGTVVRGGSSHGGAYATW